MNMVRPCQEIFHIRRRRPLEWADGYLLRIKGGIIGCRLPDELRMYGSGHLVPVFRDRTLKTVPAYHSDQ